MFSGLIKKLVLSESRHRDFGSREFSIIVIDMGIIKVVSACKEFKSKFDSKVVMKNFHMNVKKGAMLVQKKLQKFVKT